MPLKLKEVNSRNAAFFRFKETNGQYLITNDIGEYSFLPRPYFYAFLSGRSSKIAPEKYLELESKGFIRDKLDSGVLAHRYASRYAYLKTGTSLHIIVVTLRCNHKCAYCQSSSKDPLTNRYDMNISTAKKVVDTIFDSPSRNITIEFQGGEPLLNWKAITWIVDYAHKKNKDANKNLMITLVSNLTLMDKKIMDYLVKNRIHICTSLDGPEAVHNRFRIILSKENSYKNTVKWVKALRKEYKKHNFPFRPGALTTVTRLSLSYPEEIIDEYVNLGMEGIHLRPVSTFAVNNKVAKLIGYSAEEFVNFYKKALDYIIGLNLKSGRLFHERLALIFLTKILTGKDPDYLDIRSPCGAGIGQLAYNFNGDVYTCDEGRMLSQLHDESFKIGNVFKNSYGDFIDNQTIKTTCQASCLENIPGCSQCVYYSYCGICPFLNHIENGNVFKKSEYLCSIYKNILDYLFIKIQDIQIKEVFLKWLSR